MDSTGWVIAGCVFVSVAARQSVLLWLIAARNTGGCPLRELESGSATLATAAGRWWTREFGRLDVGRFMSDFAVSGLAVLVLWVDLRLQQATWQAPCFGLPLEVGKATGMAVTAVHVVAGALFMESIRQVPTIRLLDDVDERVRHTVTGGITVVFAVSVLLSAATAAVRGLLGAALAQADGPGGQVVAVLSAVILAVLSALVAVIAGLAAGAFPRLVADVTGLVCGIAILPLLAAAWSARCAARLWDRAWGLPIATVRVVQEAADTVFGAAMKLTRALRQSVCSGLYFVAKIIRQAKGEPGTASAYLPIDLAAGKEHAHVSDADEDGIAGSAWLAQARRG